MQSRRFIYALVIALLVALGSVGAEEDRYGGVLRIGAFGHPPTLDWHIGTGAPHTPRNLIYEQLLIFDAQLVPQPQLASSYYANEDATVWTFELREGVKFHDGTDFTAEDVKASFERYLQVGQRAHEYAAIQEIEIVDDFTVVFHLDRPWAAFDESIGQTFTPPAIIPKWVAEKWHDEQMTDDFIGTGPYKLELEIPGQEIRLVRFEEYTQPPGESSYLAGQRSNYVDEIQFIAIGEPATRVAALMAGDIHVAALIPLDDVEILRRHPTTDVSLVGPGTRAYIKMNSLEGPFEDPLLRRAVQAVVDHEELMAAQGPSEFWTANPVPRFVEGMWPWDPILWNYYPADMDLARSLVEASSYDGELVKFMMSAARVPSYRYAPLLLELLQDIGLNVEVVSVDAATFAQKWNNFDEWDIKHSNGGALEPPAYLESTSRTRGGLRWPWVTPEWDYWMNEARVRVDLEGRQQALREIYRLKGEGAGEIWVGQVLDVVGYQVGVHGITDFGDLMWPTEIWLEEGLR